MSAEQLFPPTPTERLARIALFVSDERKKRIAMRERHADQYDYWQGRVRECDAVLEEVAAIAEVL